MTSPQLLPYVKEICKTVAVISLKKRNVFSWLNLLFIRYAECAGFDVGFNPYSYGGESRRIAKMAVWHKLYTNPPRAPFVNYYDRVRAYFGLPPKGDYGLSFSFPERLRKILICPESSEARRSLTMGQFIRFVEIMKKEWPEAEITLATGGSWAWKGGRVLSLSKTVNSSAQFLAELRQADIVVSVDSGPLHIAAAIGKPVVALFSSAHPATVINQPAMVLPLRAASLCGVYCEVLSCKQPKCMDLLNLTSVWNARCEPEHRIVVQEGCPYAGD